MFNSSLMCIVLFGYSDVHRRGFSKKTIGRLCKG